MLLPNLLPDETLASLLARICRINGITDFRNIIDALATDSLSTSFIDSNINIAIFCEQTKFAYGTPKEVIQKTSFLFAEAWLGEIDTQELGEIIKGSRSTNLSKLTNCLPTNLTYCTSCIEDDIRAHGSSYWHRMHQIASVTSCQIHKTPLSRVRMDRSPLHYSFPLPSNCNTATGPFRFEFRNPDPDPASTNISAIANGALSETTLPCDAALTTSLLSAALKKFERNTSHLVYENQRLAQHQEPNRKNLRKALKHTMRSSALDRLQVIDCIFGSWDSFKEHLLWETVLGPSGQYKFEPKTAQGNLGAIKEHHRKCCIQFTLDKPNETRWDFAKANRKGFRWLLHNDKEWLDKALPNTSKAPEQLCLFGDLTTSN